VIIYLTQPDQTDFTAQAYTAMKDLLLSVANNNNIKLEKVSVKSLELQLKAGAAVTQKFSDLPGRWSSSVQQMVSEIKPLYSPVVKNYTLQVTKVDLPSGPVNYGDDVEIGVTVKNISNINLYQGTDYEPLVARTQNVSSKFFVNGVWLSQTQAPLMPDGSVLKPNESTKFSLKLNVPLYFGVQTESFQLTNLLGKVYPGTTFDISLNVNRLNKEVVEITSTPTGQLNVHQGPWGSSPVTAKVTPGQRYIVISRTDSGYIQLDLGNGKSGYVVTTYVKTI